MFHFTPGQTEALAVLVVAILGGASGAALAGFGVIKVWFDGKMRSMKNDQDKRDIIAAQERATLQATQVTLQDTVETKFNEQAEVLKKQDKAIAETKATGEETKATGEKTHGLVNSAMIAQMKINAAQAERIKDYSVGEPSHEADIEVSRLSTQAVLDHEANQKIIADAIENSTKPAIPTEPEPPESRVS